MLACHTRSVFGFLPLENARPNEWNYKRKGKAEETQKWSWNHQKPTFKLFSSEPDERERERAEMQRSHSCKLQLNFFSIHLKYLAWKKAKNTQRECERERIQMKITYLETIGMTKFLLSSKLLSSKEARERAKFLLHPSKMLSSKGRRERDRQRGILVSLIRCNRNASHEQWPMKKRRKKDPQ